MESNYNSNSENIKCNCNQSINMKWYQNEIKLYRNPKESVKWYERNTHNETEDNQNYNQKDIHLMEHETEIFEIQS